MDPQSRNAILESVEQLSAEGMAVLYTTHYMEEAERLCDRVGIIDLGELKAEGTRARARLARRPARPRDARAGGERRWRRGERLRELPSVHDASTKDEQLELVVDEARRRSR